MKGKDMISLSCQEHVNIANINEDFCSENNPWRSI